MPQNTTSEVVAQFIFCVTPKYTRPFHSLAHAVGGTPYASNGLKPTHSKEGLGVCKNLFQQQEPIRSHVGIQSKLGPKGGDRLSSKEGLEGFHIPILPQHLKDIRLQVTRGGIRNLDTVATNVNTSGVGSQPIMGTLYSSPLNFASLAEVTSRGTKSPSI